MNPIDLKLNNKYIKALESPIRPGALGKKPYESNRSQIEQ